MRYFKVPLGHNSWTKIELKKLYPIFFLIILKWFAMDTPSVYMSRLWCHWWIIIEHFTLREIFYNCNIIFHVQCNSKRFIKMLFFFSSSKDKNKIFHALLFIDVMHKSCNIFQYNVLKSISLVIMHFPCSVPIRSKIQ